MNLQIYELTIMFLFSENERNTPPFCWNFFYHNPRYNLILYKYISFHDNMKNNDRIKCVYLCLQELSGAGGGRDEGSRPT